MYRVIERFDANDEQCLSIDTEDVLVECSTIDEHWTHGRLFDTQDWGLVPRKCLAELYAEQPAPSKPLKNEYRELEMSAHDLTENPLSEVSYVEMSSGEKIDELPDVFARQRAKKLERKQQADEGYSSHSSGETAQLLEKKPVVSHEDEAGYEVPQVNASITSGVEEEERSCSISKKRSLVTFWKRRPSEACEDRRKSKLDDHINYYDPPKGDPQCAYFLKESRYPATRFGICLLTALLSSLAFFFALYLTGKHHIALNITLSLIIFVVVLVLPVTLISKGSLCTFVLVIPSLFSARVKTCLVIFLVSMLVLGPGFGIAEQLKVSRECYTNTASGIIEISTNETTNKTHHSGRVYSECVASFRRVNQYCLRLVTGLRRTCNAQWNLTSYEATLCSQPRPYFCHTNRSTQHMCTLEKLSENNTDATPTASSLNGYASGFKEARLTLFYVTLFLIFVVLSEAYRYNKAYLTRKDCDNVYITQKLKALDLERKSRGLKDFVVPLTRIEFHKYLIRKSLSLSRNEAWLVKKWLLTVTIFALISVCFVVMEDSLYNVLLNALDTVCRERFESTVERNYRHIIYTVIGLLYFVVMFQSHALRLRSVVCQYFYADIVEARTKHLYYKILHDRHTFAKHIRRKIQLRAEEKRLCQLISFRSKLYCILPPRVQWLCRKLSVRVCMVCDALTYVKTVQCENVPCLAHYCFECFVDAGQQCLTCQTAKYPAKSAYAADV